MVVAASPLPGGSDGGDRGERRLRAVGGGDRGADGQALRRFRTDRAGVVRSVEPADEVAAARRAARARLPWPAPLVGRLAMAVLEIEAGMRSPSQLEKFCRPEVWEDLSQRLRRRGGPFVPGNALKRVMCQEPEPGLADGVAVVGRDGRIGFVAMRLDASYGRWTVTYLTWASAA